jgi:hypothetical protein
LEVYEIDYINAPTGFKLVYTTNGAAGGIGSVFYNGPMSVSQYIHDWIAVGCNDTDSGWGDSDKICILKFDTASKELKKYYGTLEQPAGYIWGEHIEHIMINKYNDLELAVNGVISSQSQSGREIHYFKLPTTCHSDC